jgi:hypothetical protein
MALIGKTTAAIGRNAACIRLTVMRVAEKVRVLEFTWGLPKIFLEAQVSVNSQNICRATKVAFTIIRQQMTATT